MASTAAVPRINQLALSNNTRMRTMPLIEHPMKKLGDRSLLRVSGRASLDLGRPKTVASLPSIPVASSFCWSDTDLSGQHQRKRRYRKKAMATASKSDEKILEMVTERLVDGFQGMKKMFKERDPDGGDSVDKEALLQIMYNTLGYISHDRFDSLILNLGLDQLEKIPFDTFVSRFKQFKDIQAQWKPPVMREVEALRETRAHPEENLRDCDIQEWAQLSVAPEATYRMLKSLREEKTDLRSILPDECYEPGGIVTKVQMRTALQQLGIGLTDLEYKRFWDRMDPKNQGCLPLERMYSLLHLSPEGEPLTHSPVCLSPKLRKPISELPRGVRSPRDPAKAAREFKQGNHKLRGDPSILVQGKRIEGARTPSTPGAALYAGDEGEEEGKDDMAGDAEARSKIRGVKNQVSQTKMDCMVDCLSHKFDEKYIWMNMAFKLFDIQEDGCVMRIDFRRVLAEFGFPVTALQLSPLVSRFGMCITHGLISYRQLLSKLMNRNDAFVSIILDEKIQTMTGGSGTGAASDTDEESIARKLVEYLHQDYCKLATTLMRADRANKGVLPTQEVKTAVERCLSHTMTEKQWEDFQAKIPYDAEGNVRYIDFMLSFNGGEPGAWNLLKFGAVTVPRNKVVNEAPEEVKQLERAKTEMPAKMVKTSENRQLAQLRKELVLFFTDHLHDVDKRFKELDRKSHRRFSQWQFGAILRLCGFPITEKELNEVWLSLKLSDDMMSTFNNVVMEFAPNFTPFHKHKEEGEEDGPGGEGHGEGDTEGRASQQKLAQAVGDEYRRESPGERVVSPRTYLFQIMAKVRPAVRANFASLRQTFRNADPHGYGSITFRRLQFEIDRLRSGLTPDERDQLVSQFDFKKTGRCNYLAFMKAFSEEPEPHSKFVYSPRTHKMEKKPRDPIPRHAQKRLIKHWKNLRRGFQKNDRSRTGQMTIVDFKRVLKECGVPVSEEDLYHILSEFDTNMNGHLGYQEFLDALLRMG
ncbi:EF-hand calcium-binding domain-containing protein 6-like isoform X2 [Littorina saxatilis]|uniref:EF-hand calcium-binding domain-containing protein 6-like isoform X2 n=1 Tax=Littorina saxatilis TaxID=31220 RepID=UPI0038B5F5CA